MANHNSFSRSSMKARKAEARDIDYCMAHNPQKRRRRRPGNASYGVPYLSCNCRMAVVGANGRLSAMRGWGQRLPGSARKPLYNSSEVPALESQLKKTIIFDTFPFSPLSIPP
jgi:hypothetical protein